MTAGVSLGALETPHSESLGGTVRDEEEVFWRWLQQGIDAGWITQPFCCAHDGTPFTDAEMAAEEDEDNEIIYDLMDHCVHAVRLMYGVE